MKTCSNCRYWCSDEPAQSVLGECRRHPPTINPLPGDLGDPDTKAGLPRRPWPVTEARDWCAEWRGIGVFSGLSRARG
jgi:hypothetical protein